jgi:hypothetical protein
VPLLYNFLQAAADFLPGPPSPRVMSFGFRRRPPAGFRPLYCLFIVADYFTAFSSLGSPDVLLQINFLWIRLEIRDLRLSERSHHSFMRGN